MVFFFIATGLYGPRLKACAATFREFLAIVAEKRTFRPRLFQRNQLLNNGRRIAIFCECAYGD